MTYQDFLLRYGASVRTKNIIQPGEQSAQKSRANKRHHQLPEGSKIPLEFIRLDPWEAEYLFLVAEQAKEGIVETGRFHGGSTFVMCCANPRVPIWSIDIEPQDDRKLNEIMQVEGVGDMLELIVGDSQRTQYPQIGRFDLLFVDGDHSYEGCTRDLENWFPLLSPGGHVVLHDSYYGQPVMHAVKDFFQSVPAQPMISAYRPSNHWQHYAGSMAHYLKL